MDKRAEIRQAVLELVSDMRNNTGVAESAQVQPPQPQQAQPQQQQPQMAWPDRGGNRGIGNHNLETLGQIGTVGTMSAAGAAMGSGRFNRFMQRFGRAGLRNKKIGAIGGALAGILANSVGKAQAAVTKGRSSGDQMAHDRSFRLSNLIPGVGAYNAQKRNERVLLSQWHG